MASNTIGCHIGDHALLIPNLQIDVDEILSGRKVGQDVFFKLRNIRNAKRNALFWVGLQRLIEATHCYPTKETLARNLYMIIGHTEIAELPDGTSHLVPSSIAFDQLGEKEFCRVFELSREAVAKYYDCDPWDGWTGEKAGVLDRYEAERMGKVRWQM